MGLESVNYIFNSNVRIENVLNDLSKIHFKNEKYYLYEQDKYWIDIKVKSQNKLEIRIALCNPRDSLLNKLETLFYFLSKRGDIIDRDNKVTYKQGNLNFDKVLHYYDEKLKQFEKMYGQRELAISSDEFYG